MPITFISSVVAPGWPGASSGSTSSVVLAKPGGTQSGDLLLVVLASASGEVFSGPAGWTLAHEQDNGSNLKAAVYVKAAGGSEPASYTFTEANAYPFSGSIHCFRGVETASLVHQITRQTSTTADPVTGPSVTTTTPCLLVHVGVSRTTTNIDTLGTHADAANYTAVSNQGNRGASTQYFATVQSPTASTISPAGTYSGISFDADANHPPTNGIQFQVALPELVRAPAGTATATATAYPPGPFAVGPGASGASATAGAYNAQALTGKAAENVPQAAAQAVAYNAAGWVIHPVDAGAVAFDATTAVGTGAGQATATAGAGAAAGYFGAPDARRLTVQAESRALGIGADSRALPIPVESRVRRIAAED